MKSSISRVPLVDVTTKPTRKRPRRKVGRACSNCAEAHAGCSEKKPCNRCTELGLECQVLPRKPRRKRRSKKELSESCCKYCGCRGACRTSTVRSTSQLITSPKYDLAHAAADLIDFAVEQTIDYIPPTPPVQSLDETFLSLSTPPSSPSVSFDSWEFADVLHVNVKDSNNDEANKLYRIGPFAIARPTFEENSHVS